ncbi:MAG: hypothetical protein JEY79_04505 [Pseudodesulfovibrio sp.]|nr:hypothetical protein [Pseudodesulfovibrio sp.]
MKRLIPLVVSLCLFLAMTILVVDAQAGDQKPFFVHFVVLTNTMPDGTDSRPAIQLFKAEVLTLAGGFTELGPTLGGSLHPDGVHDQSNVSFIIGADKDISKELKAMTQRLFKDDGAFILVWPGKVMF